MEEINLGKIPFDVHFHPSDNLVATALINGDLHLYRFGPDMVLVRQLEVTAHRDSCRAVRFIDCGRVLLTASSDCSILATDVETGSTITRIHNAHKAAVNRLINLTESTVASGDDDGFIKVWDTRTRSRCNYFNVHESYISDMTFISGEMKLLTISGDGTLGVCNLRTNTVQEARTELYELFSIVLIKNGREIVCGSQSRLIMYSWEGFKDISNIRYGVNMKSSVDAMLKLDEDRIITGSENGIINLVRISPNKISPNFVQKIAEHPGYPVECLAFSHNRKFLGSIARDEMLKLWDLDSILPDTRNTQRQRCAPMGFG
ncbi:WD repeat-containing protein 55-like [Phaseolus vulgaris]|uniref:WD repeat-containing protein 55-like n=1 Tax=Phaseolus vulgaris TaxID=3885 RepID=UPI0035CC91F8